MLLIFSKIQNKLSQILNQTVTIPFKEVPCELDPYLKKNSKLSIIKKFLYKYLLLKLNGQFSKDQNHITKDSKVLWIYGKRNFGDAIMDLSGRALLKNQGIKIDLLTYPCLEELFSEDDIFDKTFSDPKKINGNQYDLILLSEFNLPSIRLKVKFFKKMPFACLFKFFRGPDRNRILFSHHAINFVFSLGMDVPTLTQVAKPYLCSKNINHRSEDLKIPEGEFIIISIGGIDITRSYPHWNEFISILNDLNLQKKKQQQIVLIGSNNAIEMEQEILKKYFSQLKIISFVNQVSLLYCRELISRATIFIGCDGGLMHVAHTTNTPTISLFRKVELSYLRLTPSCNSLPIQSKTNSVHSILPQEILEHLSYSQSSESDK